MNLFVSDLGSRDAAAGKNSNANPILKWKRKHYFCFVTFHALICLLLCLDRILAAKSIDSFGFLAIIGLPIAGFLLAYYMWTAIKELRDNRSIIKSRNFKYFWWGTSSAIVIFLFALLGLFFSWQKVLGEGGIKSMIFAFIGLNVLLGIASFILISIYEFCVCFDLYYHKNKEKLVKNLLKNHCNFKIEGIEESKYEDKKEEQ